MPHHKSAKKRLITAEKANVRNKSVRTAIRTGLKKIRTAKTKEEAIIVMPKLFSLMDKAANKTRAGFHKNTVANYKRKIHKVIAALSA